MAAPKQAAWKYPNLREHREKLGWTQHALSTKTTTPQNTTPVSVATIRKCQGGIPVTRRMILKIFAATSKGYREILSIELKEDEELRNINDDTTVKTKP